MIKKKKKKKIENTAGRKLFDGKDENLVISKLEEAFKEGCTDLEACNEAKISKAALYRYEEDHPEFRDRKELLKTSPVLLARKIVNKGLKDIENAKWLLERKAKGEFSPRNELSGPNGQPLGSNYRKLSDEELEAEYQSRTKCLPEKTK